MSVNARIMAVLSTLVSLAALIFICVLVAFNMQSGSHAAALPATTIAAGAPAVFSLKKHTGEIAADPAADFWNSIPALDVVLMPQTLTWPKQDTTEVERASVQGVYNDQVVGWRISWADSAPDCNLDVSRFSDAVAIEFPLLPETPVTMGEKGKPVRVLYWKGIWQKDADEHFQDVEDLYPNAWFDLYWFAQGPRPFRVPGAFKDPRSLAWFPAHQAGNTMSQFTRKMPGQELLAEGFGSLTPQPEGSLQVKGVWSKGMWHVVFVKPRTTGVDKDVKFVPGVSNKFAVAVWNGGRGNVGSRKQYSNWNDFDLGK